MIKIDEKTKLALMWITGILNKHKIPFQISGGFAAKLYGSPRPLNDIDLDIPKERFAEIVDEIKSYIVFGPAEYKDKKWNLYLITLNYHGQEIDIGSTDVKIHDNTTDTWLDFLSDLSESIEMEVEGIKVSVIPKKDLIDYKKYLDGDHQKIDIDSIS